MKLIKKLGKQYEGKDKKQHRYVNYLLQLDNGKRVLVKPVKDDDYKVFDAVAEFERTEVVKNG